MTTTTAAWPYQPMLPGQEAAPEGPVDGAGMYFIHHAVRRDLTAFVAAVRATPVEDRATWRRLAARWETFARILHHHHTAEDAGLWPELLRRADAAGDAQGRATLEAMEAEHGDIDPALAACAAGFARLAEHGDEDARRALEIRTVAARECVHRHLAHEERDAMALVQRYLTAEDWERLERDHFRPAYPPREMLTVVPWVLAGLSGDNLRRAAGAAGPVLILVWRLFLRPPFERRERAAFRYV